MLALSDLHLGVFNRERLAGGQERVLDETTLISQIEQCIADHDHIIFNGDSLELVYPHTNEQWFAELLEDWAQQAQQADTTLHWVLGNHDDTSALEQALGEIAERYPEHVNVHPVALRLGSALFTHGDLPLRQHHYDDMQVESRRLDREKPMGTKLAQSFGERGETMAATVGKHANSLVHTPVSALTHTFRRPEQQVTRLYHSLADSALLAGMDTADGQRLPRVQDIVTGHTHTPYIGLERRGDGCYAHPLRFHNSGTGVEQALFQPVRLTAGKEQAIAETVALDGSNLQPVTEKQNARQR
jgi:predicted phosphodiesterase